MVIVGGGNDGRQKTVAMVTEMKNVANPVAMATDLDFLLLSLQIYRQTYPGLNDATERAIEA